MVKIIHASDFLLGKQFNGIGKAGDIVRKSLKDAFEQSVRVALEQNASLYVIAGNLFASNLVSLHLVRFVLSKVKELGQIPCVIIPGILDPANEDSIYRHLPTEDRPNNLFVLTGGQDYFINFPETEITVYGVPYRENVSIESALTALKKHDFPGVHVAVIASSEQHLGKNQGPQEKSLSGIVDHSEFDYIAIGGAAAFHRWGNKAWSSGLPEIIDFSDTATGQIIAAEVSTGNVQAERISTSQLQWRQLELDNAKFRYNIEIEEELQQYAGLQTLLRVRVDGSFVGDGYLDLFALERSQKDRFCFLEIEDARKFTGEAGKTTRTADGSLAADYVGLLGEAMDKSPEEMKPKYFQALMAGSAMLSGKDVI